MRIFITLCCLLLIYTEVLAQTTIVGRVTDQPTGLGLPGVTVLLKGTGNSTTTAIKGIAMVRRY